MSAVFRSQYAPGAVFGAQEATAVETEIEVAASGLASVTHTATGAVSADMLAFIEVAAAGLASVTHGALGSVFVDVIDPDAITIEVACSGLAAVTHGATGAASVDLLNFIDVSAAGFASITHTATGSVVIGAPYARAPSGGGYPVSAPTTSRPSRVQTAGRP